MNDKYLKIFANILFGWMVLSSFYRKEPLDWFDATFLIIYGLLYRK